MGKRLLYMEKRRHSKTLAINRSGEVFSGLYCRNAM